MLSLREIMALRKGMRTLIKYIQDATKIKQRATQLFHQKDVQLNHLLTTDWGTEVLSRCCESPNLTQLVDDLIAKQSLGSKQALIDTLQQFRSRLDLQEQIQFENDMHLLRMLEILRERQALIYHVTAQTNGSFNKSMEILRTIPGIGDETAATILAEIVDIHYFPTPDKLSKWAGLVAKVNQSSHKKHIMGKLFKRGNKYLRRAICLAVDHIYAHQDENNPLFVFVKNLYDRTEKYWLAICAGARKLLEIIWHLLQKQEYWDPQVSIQEITTHLKQMVKVKQQVFERRSRRLKKLLVKLQVEGETLITHMLHAQKRLPSLLMKSFLQTV